MGKSTKAGVRRRGTPIRIRRSMQPAGWRWCRRRLRHRRSTETQRHSSGAMIPAPHPIGSTSAPKIPVEWRLSIGQPRRRSATNGLYASGERQHDLCDAVFVSRGAVVVYAEHLHFGSL